MYGVAKSSHSSNSSKSSTPPGVLATRLVIMIENTLTLNGEDVQNITLVARLCRVGSTSGFSTVVEPRHGRRLTEP